jgi:hypothetical protein
MEELLIYVLFYMLLFAPLLVPLIVLIRIKTNTKPILIWKWFTGVVYILVMLSMLFTYISGLQDPSNRLNGLGYLATAFFGYPILLIGVLGVLITNARAKITTVTAAGQQKANVSLILVGILTIVIILLVRMVYFGNSTGTGEGVVPVNSSSLSW